MEIADMLVLAVPSGGYISIFKLLPILVILMVWWKLMTWADKDAVAARMPREAVNCVHLGLMILGAVAFLLLPFWIGLAALLVMFLGDIGFYLGYRQKQVGLADLKKSFSKMGGKGTKKAEAKPGQVAILGKAGAIEPPDAEDPYRPAYDTLQTLLTDPIRLNAERVEFRPSEGGYSAAYWVDGVSYSLPAVDPAVGAACITYVKTYAGMDTEDRRKPQIGKMKVAVEKDRHELEITTAGTTAGESMRISIDTKKHLSHRLNTLGFSDDQMAAIKAAITDGHGIVLVAAPRQQGLTTMLYSLVRGHDAFVQHLQSIERLPREELEGITQVKLGPGASPADEFKQVEWVVSQQPDTILLDEITNPSSAHALIQYASGPEGKRVYIGMRSGSTFDALEAWRKLVGDDSMAASALSMIISGRVLRRLCDACKIAYQPDPDTLRKLNMDPTKVETLYQARNTPLTDHKGRPIPCTFCSDLHFKGRFGVFEIFVINDEVRQLIASSAPANEFRKVFRKQRSRFLQEVAFAHVEAGETSVQEVLRILRPDGGGPGASSAGQAAPGARSGQPAAARKRT